MNGQLQPGDCSGLPGVDFFTRSWPCWGPGTGGERRVQQEKHGDGLKGDL